MIFFIHGDFAGFCANVSPIRGTAVAVGSNLFGKDYGAAGDCYRRAIEQNPRSAVRSHARAYTNIRTHKRAQTSTHREREGETWKDACMQGSEDRQTRPDRELLAGNQTFCRVSLRILPFKILFPTQIY